MLYTRVLGCGHETRPVHFSLSSTSCCYAVFCPDVLIGASIYWPLHGRTVARRPSSQQGAVQSRPGLRSRNVHSAFLVRIPMFSYVRGYIRNCYAAFWLLHSCTAAVRVYCCSTAIDSATCDMLFIGQVRVVLPLLYAACTGPLLLGGDVGILHFIVPWPVNL